MNKPEKPDWINNYVWAYYLNKSPSDPEKKFLQDLLTHQYMKRAWKLLDDHIEKTFPCEVERLLHFTSVAFDCYLGIPAAELLTKGEADKARDDAAKKARELAKELDRLGYWLWGPEDIAPDVMDWLSESEKDSWDSIHAINQTLTMKRLLNRLADKLNTENQRPRVLSRPKEGNSKKHFMARELAVFLKGNFRMTNDCEKIIASTIRTIIGPCATKDVTDWTKKQ